MEQTELNEIKEPRGPRRAFAIVGFVSGIVGLALAFLPILGVSIGIEGLVLSCLGQKSILQRKKADIGVGLNIATIAIGIISIIVFYAILLPYIINQATY